MKVLTIDIGGTFIKYALMTPDAEILEKGKVPTPRSREEEVEAVGQIFDRHPADLVAVSMPGIIDTTTGYCSQGGALDFNVGFMIRDAIKERCGVPVTVENDAKCAAIAEASVGALSDVNDGFLLTLGTMIGGGYIKDRQLHKGIHFSAGETAFIITDLDGDGSAPSVFGNKCSVNRLIQGYGSGEEFFAAFDAGDRNAAHALDVYTHGLAVQIFNIQTVLDPEKFAIGGGISARKEVIDCINRNLDKLYANCPYHVPHAVVVPARYLNDANLIGALQCALKDTNR